MTKIITGIVIAYNKYKDNDAILNVINSEGSESLIIRGCFSKNSKFLQFAKSFYYGEFEVYEGKTKYFKLRNGKIILDYSLVCQDFTSLSCIELMQEIIYKTYTPDQANNFYLLARTTLSKLTSSNILKLTFLYVAFAIKFNGYSISTDNCSTCKKNDDLIGLSYKNGGLICESCFVPNEDIKLTEDEIELIKIAFENRYLDAFSMIDENSTSFVNLIEILCNFISYYNNIRFISLNFIKVHS